MVLCLFAAACGDASAEITITTGDRDAGGVDEGDASAPTPDPDAGKPAPSSSCLEDLTAKGVTFTKTEARGVTDAVKVGGPINGVLFASGTNTTPAGDPMACEFVRTLWRFADVLKAHGFVRIGTLGSYCYRCCCSWSETNTCRKLTDPEPQCGANGYSNHSWGRAVDIRYLYKADGTRYDVNDVTHWVKSTSPTCTTALAAQSGISKELYTMVCAAAKEKVFSIALTPNYNAAHRNHFHMDIGEAGAASGFTVKSLEPGAVDDCASDRCGDE